MWGSKVRLISVLLGAANLLVGVLGAVLLFVAYSSCNRHRILPFLLVSIFATLRILTIFKIANAQEAITKSILDSPATTDALDIVVRRDRRVLSFLIFHESPIFIQVYDQKKTQLVHKI